MTLYVTGGHLTPALAVVDELQKKYPEVHIRFFGREFSQIQTRQPSHERREIEKRDIVFIPLNAAKIHRTHPVQNVFEIIKFPLSLWTIWHQFRIHKPDVVLSFGGYMAFPVCVMGKVFGARIITHEQTKVAGLANQVIGFIADVIALAHEESREYFPAGKVIVTGNPIREALFREYKVPPSWVSGAFKTRPLLYVTGGSQGSQVINQTIVGLLPRLVQDFYIVHQCGVSIDARTLRDLEREREKLPTELQEHYTVREWIEEKEVSFLLRNAKFVICRAGANTVQELTLSATPAIFIPLAFAYNDEQYKNAQALVEKGASLLVEQKNLVPDSLLSAITQMQMNFDKYKSRMEDISKELIRNGTSRLIKCIMVDK
jgi:UDP-N-acetylglucosamine--N-acetylmuramyl-(pentapeptide) pyrophosphoryl-undecaprenol N-acetylglucosamine transferase